MLSSKTGSPRLLVTLLTKALSTGIQATMIVVAPSILQCRRRSVRNGGVDDAEDDDSRGPDDEVGDIIGEVLASEGGKKNNPIGGDTGSTKQIRTDTGRPLKGGRGHFVHQSYAEYGAKHELLPPVHPSSENSGSGVNGKV